MNVAQDQGQFYKALGDRLRKARLSAGMSQGKLADCIGMSRSSVANIETGRQPIYAHSLVRIATQLGMAVTKLIPAVDKEFDAAEEDEQSRISEEGRQFWNLVLRKSTLVQKDTDDSEIRSGQKTRGRVAKRGARPKGARAPRKAGHAP